MTRKDYVLIATALKSARNIIPGPALDIDSYNHAADSAAYALANALAADNAAFDRARFLKACGVQS